LNLHHLRALQLTKLLTPAEGPPIAAHSLVLNTNNYNNLKFNDLGVIIGKKANINEFWRSLQWLERPSNVIQGHCVCERTDITADGSKCVDFGRQYFLQ